MIMALADSEISTIAAKHIEYLFNSVLYVNGMGEDTIYLCCLSGNPILLKAILEYSTN